MPRPYRGNGIVEEGNLTLAENDRQDTHPLPDGWVEVPISRVGELLRGVSYKKNVARGAPEEDYVPILRATNIQDGHLVLDSDLVYVPSEYVKPEQQLKIGDVVICMSSGSKHLVGKTGQLRRSWRGSFGAFCAAVRFDPSLDRRFAAYFFESPGYRNLIRDRSSGININNLRQGDIETLHLPIPPLAEQHRIADTIEAQFTRLDAAVAALERVQANLARYRASVLQAACEGRLVPTEAELARRAVGAQHAAPLPYEPADVLLERILDERRARWEEERWAYEIERSKKKAAQAERKAAGLPYYIRDLKPEHWQHRTPEEYEPYLPKSDKWKQKYDEPEPPDTEDLPGLPKGWVWTNMATITVEGPQNGLYLPQDLYGTGIPILRIDDYQYGWSRSSDELRRVEADEDDIQKYALEVGDLVINRVNSPSHLGKCLVVSERNIPSVFESNMMRLRISDIVLPEYVEIYLQSSFGRQALIANAKWAVNQASINQGDVSQTAVALPPLAEQRRIVAEVERRLSVVRAMEEAVEANLVRARRLRQSILKRAFEGRLVPQNPEDEPASVLLERIR
jgi:type I restriction enzyme S subunit